MDDRRTVDLYRRAEHTLTDVAAAIQRQEVPDLECVSEVAAAIGDSVRQNDHLVVHALAGPIGSPLVTNMINVSILSAKIGAGLGYHGEELDRLTLAGLLHDVGLFAVPQSLVMKTGRLTGDERTLIEQHPELGYHVVHKVGSAWAWLADVVRQAHERWNGQGYPNKLKGRAINEFAQIIGVVDVFDALISPRSYRRRFFPHEAVHELIVAERKAFPREVIKALVQQLSAYPLGTLVRLTTGESGAVVRINPDFPLRPVLHIDGGRSHEARELDLSRTPLVAIVETLEPPDTARVAFPSGMPADRRTTPTTSDQFSSLLESLDALATAIQGVVEAGATISTRVKTPEADEESPTVMSGFPVLLDVNFEKELIGLFALEAREWLAQIHAALRQLGEGARASLRPKLYSIMLHGLTNLAKSASTVHQREIERMVTDLLPVLHRVGKQNMRTMTSAVVSLQRGLDRIAAAVHGASSIQSESQLQAAELVEAEPYSAQIEVDLGLSDPRETAGESSDSHPEAGGEIQDADTQHDRSVPVRSLDAVSGASLLNALRDLQQVRSRSMQPTRDVLEAVIVRAEREPMNVTAERIRQILGELDQLDEEFLHEIHSRVPRMSQKLTALREVGVTDFVTTAQLDPVVEEVDALYQAAGHVQAGMISMFLQGLRSFLVVAAYRKTTNLPQRLETVMGRIEALEPMAEQWVSIGRVERVAIAEILPV
ncbi:hypothetical protein W02_07700 [Nitrospira sp. KM1]|uniref:HD domain-containing phosphohydrolase n=1 Tax=Nitrospira sp. KM1 TaxID=1936990 RepID=UPI0013A7B5A0|nr:HD domain-containing phosphohydrolase [Nitrospira sp. KM1]BCA53630.1 hypothetical protein W02_07700 [Nitrospira sp. KM1]